MRAAAFGYDEDGSATIEVRELDDPAPGPTEAVVRVEACSLNHSSVWRLEGGRYEAPSVSGSDVAGVVESLGEDAAGTTDLAEGDRVLLCPNETCGTCERCSEGPETLCASYRIYRGGFAERCAVPADRLIRLPASVSFVEASVLPIAYVTARAMLRRADVGSGDLVVVPGATGGVGIATVQLADLAGARTIGTTSSPEKAERLPDFGVDDVVVAGDAETLGDELEAFPPADAVINHLGGPFTAVGLEALRRGGRMAVCGTTAGRESTVNVGDLALAQKRLVGSTMGTRADLATVVDLVADGDLDVAPVVDREYPLAETPAAFAAMRDRDLLGKLVVRPNR